MTGSATFTSAVPAAGAAEPGVRGGVTVGVDAPGVDAPGVDAPGVDAPGVDAPGSGMGTVPGAVPVTDTWAADIDPRHITRKIAPKVDPGDGTLNLGNGMVFLGGSDRDGDEEFMQRMCEFHCKHAQVA